MSNIDKQALREIAAAAVGAHERLSVMPPDDIFDISLAEGTQLDADITALNALNSAANPTTVLALLASLEAAEKRIAELEAREIKPAKGEVLVVVSGFTGCGKSAIAGEIEIAMKAIGVPVQWTNGDAEKRMTGADWLTAIEMYKPTVRIVEVNVPRATGIRIKGE
ncbi:ead/Ea22-like family protein [Escherichia coli]|nr:ead/Ea22-like family protein [Escherichia coli]